MRGKRRMAIALCGFMGSGKSTVAEIIADKRNVPVYDLDRVIEEKYGGSINSIFKEKGEEYFRALESRIISEPPADGAYVLSLGGGALEREENVAALKEYAYIVYLDVPFEECYLRIKDCDTRPLVKSLDKDALRERYLRRAAKYGKEADYCVAGDSSEEIADKIMRYMEDIWEDI